MKFPWPPSEQDGWRIETQTKTKETLFLFPMMPQTNLLLAFRLISQEPVENLEVVLANEQAFLVPVSQGVWTQFPYPIEFHAIGPFWKGFNISAENYQLDLAYFPWKTRSFRMRALIDNTGTLIAAYRINKNGQTVSYHPPKNDLMRLPEDTYAIPPTGLIQEKSILLLSAGTHIPIKKTPEGRYFSFMKNEDQEYAKEAT
jgi:hypothetical protein